MTKALSALRVRGRGYAKALDAAEDKGRKARLDGKERTACPYGDHRTMRGSITWSRAFIRAWLRGWKDTDRFMKDMKEKTDEDDRDAQTDTGEDEDHDSL